MESEELSEELLIESEIDPELFENEQPLITAIANTKNTDKMRRMRIPPVVGLAEETVARKRVAS